MEEANTISNIENPRLKNALSLIVVFFIFSVLAGITKNYLLFHTIVEIFGAVIAFCLFTIAWNSRKFLDNNFFLFLGIAYFFIGAMDLLHALAYSGMNIFIGYNTDLATQVWVATRYLQSISLLIASFLLISKSKRINSVFIFLGYILVSSLLFLSIFQWRIFPTAFVDGVGLTTFKKISEYVICFILLLSLLSFFRKKDQLEKSVFYLIVVSIILTIVSELSFTLYTDVYGYFNKLGHIIKAVAFFALYLAFVETGVKNPQLILFRNLKKNEESLIETKNYLDNLLDYANAPIIVWDPDYRITKFNHAFEHITGRLASEVIGLKLDILFPEEHKKESIDLIHQTSKGRRWETVEIPIQHKDGHIYTVLWNSAGLYAPDKKTIIATIAQGQDITKRKLIEKEVIENAKHLEEDKAKDEALLESINDGIIALDKDHKVIFINKSFEKLTGYGRQELIGKDSIKTLKILDEKGVELKEEDYPAKIILLQDVKFFKKDYVCVAKDGSLVAVSITVTPIVLKGEIIGTIFDFMDITKEKEIDRAKTEFASLASHQLRTPLSSLSLAAELLFPEIKEKLDKEQNKYLRIINSSIKEMIILTEDLLNISRIEMGTLAVTPEPTNLDSFVRDLLKNFSIQISGKKLELIEDFDKDLPKINIDRKLFRQIIDNLISNSIKYNKTNGKIEVKIKIEKDDILVCVSDSGYGIPKHQHSQVFKKFFRSDNVLKSETKGTGLGLYIVKSLVEQYGGQIWFESEENKGSAFYFTVPFNGMNPKTGKIWGS